jgi:hypothetical protein
LVAQDIEDKMSIDSRQQDDTPIVKSTDDARAGVTGQGVRYVLGFGLAGVVVAFFVLSVYFGLGGH